MHKILLVEDEHTLAHGIQLNLEMEGHQITHYASGENVVEAVQNHYFDLIILDIMLPEKNGFQITEEIRTFSDVPIMFISAKNNSTDRIKGLKIGGNDYLAKPFDLEELLLRVNNLLSRNISVTPSEEDNMKINDHLINFKNFTASTNLGEKRLSKKEVDVLKLLLERKGEAVSREEILEKVWSDDTEASSRTIDNFIVNFRKYFEENPKNPQYFLSIRGVGYLLKMPQSA